jgi:hypothetical protein
MTKQHSTYNKNGEGSVVVSSIMARIPHTHTITVVKATTENQKLNMLRKTGKHFQKGWKRKILKYLT